LGIGDWGLGIGDWGLGIGPNPQYPIPNPHLNLLVYIHYVICINKLKKMSINNIIDFAINNKTSLFALGSVAFGK